MSVAEQCSIKRSEKNTMYRWTMTRKGKKWHDRKLTMTQRVSESESVHSFAKSKWQWQLAETAHTFKIAFTYVNTIRVDAETPN